MWILEQRISTLIRFLRSIQPGSIAAFYFSGHGLQFNGENYLVPTNNLDIGLDNLDQVALNAQQLIKAMHNRNPRLILIILDCCRSYWHAEPPEKGGFLNRRSGKFKDGLAPMRAPPATIIVYACAADAVSSALSINDRNSLYTYHLLNHIRTPNLDIDTVLKNVGMDVLRDPVNMEHQVPFRYSSCNELIFLAGNGPMNYPMLYGYKQLGYLHRKSFFRSSKHIHFEIHLEPYKQPHARPQMKYPQHRVNIPTNYHIGSKKSTPDLMRFYVKPRPSYIGQMYYRR